MTYVICSATCLVLVTIRVIHVLPIMLYLLEYYGLLLLSLVGLAVCGCSKILQIYVRKLIGGDELFIYGVD